MTWICIKSEFIGPLISCDTIDTKSDFIRSIFLLAVMS